MLWAARKGAIITAGKYSKLLGETKALLSFEITLFLHKLSILAGMVHLDDSKLEVYNIFIVKIF